MAWVAVGAAAAGAGTGFLLNKFGGGGNSGGSAEQTSRNEPWAGAQPFLLGQAPTIDPLTGESSGGIPGTLNEASNLYSSHPWSPQQSTLNVDNMTLRGQLMANGQVSRQWEEGGNALNGWYDAKVNPASLVDPAAARASMGLLDPTSSLQRLMSGNVDTSTLNPLMQSGMQRLTDNFNTNTMPSIRGGAMLNGQYGGSRQGIAEGLAAKGLSQAQGDMSANMLNNAFNTAQQNMYGTSNNLNSQALQNSQNNSQIQLQNNSQSMQNAQNNLKNRMAGIDMINTGINSAQDYYNQMQANAAAPQTYDWNNLKNYNGIVAQAAGMGGQQTSTSNQSMSSNPMGALVGGGLLGYGLYNNYNKSNAGNSNGGNTGTLYGNTAPNVNNYNWQP